MRQAYASTVFAPIQLAATIIVGAALSILAGMSGTVRPGPTLCLRLCNGEIIRVSLGDPVAAQHIRTSSTSL